MKGKHICACIFILPGLVCNLRMPSEGVTVGHRKEIVLAVGDEESSIHNGHCWWPNTIVNQSVTHLSFVY